MRKVKILIPGVFLLAVAAVGAIIGRSQILNKKLTGVCTKCNIVVIDIDVLRADALSCNQNKNSTPNICRFFKNSYYFTNHISQSNLTRPSYYTFLTSLYPSSHNIWTQFNTDLPAEVLTLPKILKKYGYQTYYAGSIYNQVKNDGYDGRAEDGLDLLEKIKAKNSPAPFFLFFYAASLHSPYLSYSQPDKAFGLDYSSKLPPNIPKTMSEFDDLLATYVAVNYTKVFNQRVIAVHSDLFAADRLKNKEKILALYKALRNSVGEEANDLISNTEIEYDIFFNLFDKNNLDHLSYLKQSYLTLLKYTDGQLAKIFSLLESKDFNENTIVILRSDHGDEFGEHGQFSHRNFLYQEIIHTPLMIEIPHTSGKGIKNLSQDIDLGPTLLELIGAVVPAQAQGKSLVPMMEKDDVAVNQYQISQKGLGFVAAFGEGEYKLIIKDKRPYELYRLAIDPREKTNLIDKEKSKAEEIWQEYQKILNSHKKYQSSAPLLPKNIDVNKIKKIIYLEGYF